VTRLRQLIVNADDLGHSTAVNAGIAEARERGIVTSASLMVLRPAAEEAAEQARADAGLSVGLHVELGEWTYRDGAWVAVSETEADEIAGAVSRQLSAFRSLTGRDPTHLDSHQHVHLREPARSVLGGLGSELGLPVRHLDGRTRYCGEFYGQTATGESVPSAITVDALVRIVQSLPQGTTELCCHPGKGEIPGSSYGPERERELEALCHPQVRAELASSSIELISFREVA
jgi:predicted glycoside hydrolase/deacetylase ChbG (UPF0249 family)